MTRFYTAFVVFTVRNAAGELETVEKAQDVTDDVTEGANREDLAERLYWKHCDGLPGFVEVIDGGVKEEA